MMATKRICATVLACVILTATASSATAATTPPTQTKRQAELNILRSPLYFWRVGLHGFIRTKTRTFRTNVTVICNGGKGATLRAHIFLCVLRYSSKTAKVRYTARGKYAFKLKIIART